VKRKFIKRFAAKKARKWVKRWALHPNGARADAPLASGYQIWLPKYLTREIERSQADVFNVPESEHNYSRHFYQYSYLETLPENYICDYEGCGKIYNELQYLRRHMRERHFKKEESQAS